MSELEKIPISKFYNESTKKLNILRNLQENVIKYAELNIIFIFSDLDRFVKIL